MTTTTHDSGGSYVGRRTVDRNGERFVRGAGRYTGDIHLPREATMVLLRSPRPHARIVAIDTSAAEALDGVLAVATGPQLYDRIGSHGYLWNLPGQKVGHGRPLAPDRVRHVGEPLAAVVARDQYTAEDAVELIEVEYELLPALSTCAAALAPEAPLLHDEWGENVEVSAQWPVAIPGLPAPQDPGPALEAAHLVVRHRFTTARIGAVSMEARAVVADYRPGPELTVYTSTQGPHIIREAIASMLGVPENRIRVVAPDVGGAFGMKGVFYPEEALVPYFALALRRPVRWIEQRDESFVADLPSRAQEMDLEVGFDAEGRIVGVRSDYVIDLGSAPSSCGAGTGWATGSLLCGPYDVSAVDIHARAVVTNKVPLGGYRGYGQPEANFPMERTLDIAARRLGIDPIELRRRNVVPADAMPYTNVTGNVFDSGDYAEMLDALEQRPSYRDALAWRDTARAEGRTVGVGMAFYNENTNFGPSGVLPLIGISTGGWDSSTVRVEPDGRIRVVSSQTPMGQGIETAYAQTVADEFRVPLEHVTVHTGDTDSSHYTAYTSGASRAAGVGGSAVLLAAAKAREKMLRIAAHLLEADPADLDLVDGGFRVAGTATPPVSIPTVARAAYLGSSLPDGEEPGLVAEAAYDPPGMAFSYGVVVAAVEIDPETGQVRVERLLFGHDCGTQLNPAIVEHQVIGGALQGLGAALTETMPYDEHGRPRATSLKDYLLPLATEAPEFDLFHTVHPTPFTVNGAKGVGESGVIAAPSAIVNAVQDALPRSAPEITAIPVLPERVLAGLRHTEEHP